MKNDLEGIVQGHTVDGELAPFDVDPASAEKMGYANELAQETPPQIAETSDALEAAAPDFKPVNEGRVRYWLGLMFRGGYVVNSMLDKDADEKTHAHWIASDDELDFIAPMMTEWVNSIPAVANAVNQLETKGAPALLGGMFAFRQIKSLRIRRNRRVSYYDQLAQREPATSAESAI